MKAHQELQDKVALMEELQRRLENRQDGFAYFEEEFRPIDEEEDMEEDEYQREEISSLERLTDFFGDFSVEDIETLPDTQREQLIELFNRALRLLEDARHFDPIKDLYKKQVHDKARFIQAADEIFEDIPERLHQLKRKLQQGRPRV